MNNIKLTEVFGVYLNILDDTYEIRIRDKSTDTEVSIPIGGDKTISQLEQVIFEIREDRSKKRKSIS